MAQGNQQDLQGGRELEYLSQKDSYLGSILRRIISAINTSARNAAVSPIGNYPAPPKVDSISVAGTFSSSSNTITTTSEHLHWVLTHNQSINKGINYITEIDSSPNFPQPHQIFHNGSRSGFLNLPALNTDGSPVLYYMRSYAQYPGSQPSEKTVLGGQSNPTAIVLTGTSKMSLLPSQGAGTASQTGQQGGLGFGNVLTRPAPQTKRSVVQH